MYIIYILLGTCYLKCKQWQVGMIIAEMLSVLTMDYDTMTIHDKDGS